MVSIKIIKVREKVANVEACAGMSRRDRNEHDLIHSVVSLLSLHYARG